MLYSPFRRHIPTPSYIRTKEREAALLPLLLPALLDAALAEWSPEDNSLSREADRPLLRYYSGRRVS